MTTPMNIAHVNPETKQTQSLDNHVKGVATLAAQFASGFGLGEYAYIMGLLHDKGKERHDFQAYIRQSAGMPMEEYAHFKITDKQHAYIGAAMLTKERSLSSLSKFLGYQIMGHHTGLPDYPDFDKKIKLEVPAEISAISGMPSLPHLTFITKKYPNDGKEFWRHYHHLARVLFSCLVDADFLDTEKFMSPERYSQRVKPYDLSKQLQKLEAHMAALHAKAKETPINEIRCRILQRCLSFADSPVGFYSLDVPTGTGKTLSSISWAIRHAIKHGKKRVIYAIPYTSIVTQTAQVFNKIFGSESVLEHHSNVTDTEDKDISSLRLATENWDYPIVVTTNVQLFQSMMSNKVSKCRKLHNLADSVLVLDEVQSLPIVHLQPILDALKAYNKLFGMSVLLSTASMPAIDGDKKMGQWQRRSIKRHRTYY